jgi:hypothetical protein
MAYSEVFNNLQQFLLVRIVEFISYPKNSVVEILGDHMKFADFIRIVNMFSDTWTGIIVAYVHYANGFDAVWKTGEVEVPISFRKGNHLSGYTQVCGNRLIDRSFDFLRFVIGQGSSKVIVTLGLLFVHMGAEATSTTKFPDHCLIKYVFR